MIKQVNNQITEEIIHFYFLNELELPKKKIGYSKEDSTDYIMGRKLERQEKIEDKFVRKFFELLSSNVPNFNISKIDEFIERYFFQVYEMPGQSDAGISIHEIMNFINRLGYESEFNDIAIILGLISGEQNKGRLNKKDLAIIKKLKNDMIFELLQPIKRIMRGNAKDDHSTSGSHAINVQERYNEWRVRNILNKWKVRKLRR